MLNGKYEVILFQPYLRKFVLNFGKYLTDFVFINIANPPIVGGGYHNLPTFEKEVSRVKTGWQGRIRQILGIPSVRIYLRNKGDLLFTYGCLVLTNKPYSTYLETGLALYNYDLRIAKNPIARTIVAFLATRKNCRHLIFVSEASKKSFFSTINYGEKTAAILKEKSIVIYPIPLEGQKASAPKKRSGKLKLLFPGTFYMKGGMEVVHSYERLLKEGANVELTIITAVHMLRDSDREYIQSLPGLRLLDAKLNEQEMADMYRLHDILLLPTYREGFGLVLVEALSWGMPIICTDQYATKEMVIGGENGYIHPHPLQDYDPKTYRMFGNLRDPKIFYAKLFHLQAEGGLLEIEMFLRDSVLQYLRNETLLEQHSQSSLRLYQEKFHPNQLGSKLNTLLLQDI